MIRLLTEILNIDTQNPPGNERILADYILRYLSGCPCEAFVQETGNGRANVIARIRGRETGGGLMLNGHLDTVPNGDGWHTEPQKTVLKDGRLYARGSSDMKSGLAVMLHAFREAAESGVRPAHDILFAGTADEEAGGTGAVALAEAGMLEGIETILIGEPTDLGLGLAAKGCLWLRLRATGRTCHGAYPERGVNAIEGVSGFTRVIRETMGGGTHPLLGNATATLTRIEGGIKVNMVPDRAEAMMDLRTLPGTDHRALTEEIRRKAAEWCAAHPGLEMEVTVENNRLPVETRPGSAYARRMEQLYEELFGERMKHTGTAFFSDASVFLCYADCDVIQFGPGESALAHTPDESVSVAACEKALKLMRALLKEA